MVDAGGPGAPIVELLRTARLATNLRPILITTGDTLGNLQGGIATIPRKGLISNLLLLIDRGTLNASKTLANRHLFVEELLQLRAGASNHPEKGSAHDDIVMALAIAVWEATRTQPHLHPQAHAPTHRPHRPPGVITNCDQGAGPPNLPAASSSNR